MMTRTSVLRHQFDERMYSMIRARTRVHNPDRTHVLGLYAREARRAGWTWDLIAHAAMVSPTTVKRWAEHSRAAELALN